MRNRFNYFHPIPTFNKQNHMCRIVKLEIEMRAKNDLYHNLNFSENSMLYEKCNQDVII